MSFALFILLNSILLIRPEELYPEIAGVRLYLIVIILNLLIALPKLLANLSPDVLVRQPITVCVLGLLIAVGLSYISRGRVGLALDFVPEFAKVIAYYLLLVAVVNTPRRFCIFLGWQVIFVCILVLLGLLQFHEYIDYDGLRPVVERRTDPVTRESLTFARLCSSGVFHDPNDLCLMLTFGSLCCLYLATNAGNWLTTILWLLPICLFAYALVLTQSRGGLLGMLAAGTTLVYFKIGWKRALPFVALCVPMALVALGGRQGDINLGKGDTGFERVMYWAQGFTELGRSPFLVIFGIGANEYNELVGHVAHNSFVHAYVELGLFGGTLFLGAFATAVAVLVRMNRKGGSDVPPVLARGFPFVIAMVAGYGAGIYSLSRNYVIPTYLCLGIAASFVAMAVPRPPIQFRCSKLWLTRMALLGISGLVFLKYFTQVAGVLGI